MEGKGEHGGVVYTCLRAQMESVAITRTRWQPTWFSPASLLSVSLSPYLFYLLLLSQFLPTDPDFLSSLPSFSCNLT